MKKILLSLVMIAAVGAVAIGATRAYFTADYTAEDNTFATGTLSFDLRDRTGYTTEIPVNAQNMVPGVKETTYFNVYNHNSSIDIKYYLYAQGKSGSSALYDKLRYSLSWCTNPVDLDQSCTSSFTERKTGWLKNLTNSVFAVPWLADNDVAPGKAHQWKLELWLDESAGNELQGKFVTFDLVGHATQSNNPGWTQ